ncbi:MAG: hypothetical protein ACYSW6_09615 [Planctomycetota bacterium]|jgi:hypothetical protein
MANETEDNETEDNEIQGYIALENMSIDELASALADMEKAIEDLGSAFTYASIGTTHLPEALALAVEETFPAWSRHNPVFLGTSGTSVKIRELHWPERLLARLLAASMSERVPDGLSEFLYWHLMNISERVFKYYDKRHYGEDGA